MNRKIMWIILLMAVCFATILVINLKGKNDINDVASFSATVLENNKVSILVEPFEGEDELKSSDKIVVRVAENSATLKDLSEFTPGTKVTITYNGIIMESYPAQINAYNVEKINY